VQCEQLCSDVCTQVPSRVCSDIPYQTQVRGAWCVCTRRQKHPPPPARVLSSLHLCL
jgi:hypothetical protein